MTMQTDDLIHRLGNQLVPVRPLPPPWRRATTWLLVAGGYLTPVMLLAWRRHGVLATRGEWTFIFQQLAVIATAVTAALAAFASVIPGPNRRVLVVPLAPAALMMGTLGVGCLTDWRMHGTLGLGQETDWPCVVSLTLGGVMLWALAMAMLRRGAPLAPRVSSGLAGVAALSVANLEACVARPHVFSITVVVWHGLTTALIGTLFMRAGGGLLVWKTDERGGRRV
jgi:hypothetical protein